MEHPVWSGLDFFILACTMFFGIFLFSAVGVGILHSRHPGPIEQVTRNPSVWIVIPAMGAAYLVMFVVLYLLAGMRRVPLWSALNWNWPSGLRWTGFVLAGMTLAMVAGLLEKLLPVPKSLPIEEIFRQPGAPQLMALFGVAIAPFIEETLFRGLLYPISNRWLRDVLNDKQRIRRGRLIFLLLVPLGFAAQWRPPIGGGLLAVAVLFFTLALFAKRALENQLAGAAKVILPGLIYFSWALFASHLSRLSLERVSVALLLLVLAMTVLGLKLQPGIAATRFGITLAFLLTAASFALVHSDQLGNAWAPVLVLFLVSSVLTFTRAQTKSLASSFLIHFAYNSTLFGGMYFATDHFRHLEHIAR